MKKINVISSIRSKGGRGILSVRRDDYLESADRFFTVFDDERSRRRGELLTKFVPRPQRKNGLIGSPHMVPVNLAGTTMKSEMVRAMPVR